MKNISKLFMLKIIIFSFSLKPLAQNNFIYEKNFIDYKNYFLNKYGIICNNPKKFVDLKKYYIIWKVRKNHEKHTGYIRGPLLQSSNKNCIIMYPVLPTYVSEEDRQAARICAKIERILNRDTSTTEPKIATNSDIPRGFISAELKTALGLYYSYKHPLNNDTAKFNFNDYVTIISGKKAREMFNADTIYLYDIPGADSVYFLDKSLEEMRRKKYPYCTGIFIARKDRATMDIKLFFTEKGVRKKEEYINMLSKHIWYVDDFKHE